jgi:hypothetical protein
MSDLGQMLRIHSALEPTFVRCWSSSDKKWFTAANATVRHQHWASRFAVDRIALAVIQGPK